MGENPIKYSDLIDFSDNKGIKQAIKDIIKLKEVYKDFTDVVTNGQIKLLTDQQNALAKSVAELSAASKDLNITQQASQKQLIENAAAMAKLDAQNKQNQATQAAAKAANTAVKGSVDQLNATLREQIKQYNALGQTKQKDIAKAGQLVQSINQTRAQLATLNGAVRQNITAFTAATGSYNQLDAQTKKLIIDLKNLPNAFTTNAAAAKTMQAEINANIAKLKEFDKAMNITTRNVGNYSSAFADIGSTIGSMLGPIALFTAALSNVRKIIDSNIEISDSLADLRRTAQLTEVEAGILLETLKGFDTRTSLKGLLDIAIIGGQLGVAKQDIAGFTQAIDELAVVLSNEIPGGAEEVATALGKINGIFKTQVKEGTTINEAYNKTGSAILALGQVGLATGAYLQDFALRTAGIANTAKISLPTILAYSAVLEESGSSAEVAGTAFNRLVGSLASKRKEFFAIAKLADANLTLKEFSDIINTDANKALQLFFKGLDQGKNLTQFTDLLGTIKIKAGPAQNAIIGLAQNQEKLNERISQSVKAYEDGTLAIDQFEVKNNNLAASVDKLSNAFTNLTTSPDNAVGSFFKLIVDSATNAIKLVGDLSDILKRLGQTFPVLIRGRSGFDQSIAEDKANKNASRIASNRDTQIGIGLTRADMITKNNQDEPSLRKALAREQAKLDVLFKQSNYAKAFAKDTANSSESIQGQINKYLRLQPILLQQQTAVQSLKKTYDSLYKAQEGPGDADKFLTDDKGKKAAEAEAKRLAAAEKAARASNDRILDAAAKLAIAELDLKYAAGKKDAEDEINYENEKLKILQGSYDKRLDLYKGDKEQYAKLSAEKVQAEAKAAESISKIVATNNEKIKAEREKLAKSVGGSDSAQKDLLGTKLEANIRYGQATGTISDDDANRQLFAQRSKDIQADIDAAQDRLDKLNALDSEYYDAKKDKLNAEKALVKEQSDYEINEAQRVADRKRQLQQAVQDNVVSAGNALFDIASSFNENAEAQENARYEKDVELAGKNADAKAAIERDHQRKSLELRRKQAVFDKAQALFNIAIQTALAVSAALAPPPLGLGPILGIPFAIQAGVAGAIQAGVVLAKPLPKYKTGRKGGKSEYAVVNDGGPEIIESKKGEFKVAGGGKETVTFLNEGDKVHTNKKSAQMVLDDFNTSRSASIFVDNLIEGQGIIRAQNEMNQRQVVDAIIKSKTSHYELVSAFREGISDLEIQQLFVDEKGHNTFIKKRNSRIHDQNARNTFGGQG